MLRSLREWWATRRRIADLQTLWPECKEVAPDLDQARSAFAVHAYRDWAWLILGEAEIRNRIDRLT